MAMWACSFTWVLWERGQLGRYFEGDDLPGYTLYTATWGLIAPELADAYPGNQRMGVQVCCSAPAVIDLRPSAAIRWRACQ